MKIIAAVAATLLTATLGHAALSAQKAPQRMPRVFALDDQQYITDDSVHYVPPGARGGITIPDGFITDFASVPNVLRWMIGKKTSHNFAGLVHDYLYWRQECNRDEADRVFYLALEQAKASFKDRHGMHKIVVLFGADAWKGNAQDRKSGLPRIAPAEFRAAVYPTGMSADYRRRMRDEGIQLDPRPGGYRPLYCSA